MNRAGLAGPDPMLTPSVRAKHGINRKGKAIHYYLNYSGTEQTFSYPQKTGMDLLTQSTVGPSQKIP